MLKRSRTEPVYFQLKETLFRGEVVYYCTHSYTLSWRFGSDGPCKWTILCFGRRCCNITHTYIHFHGDLGQRGHAKGPSQKNHLKAKSKWSFQSQAPLVVEIEGKKHGKAAQFYSTF